MSVSEFASQATLTWAEKQRGAKIKINIITRIVRKDCKIMWLAWGNSNNELEERLVKNALRFRSGPPDLEIRLCVSRTDRN